MSSYPTLPLTISSFRQYYNGDYTVLSTSTMVSALKTYGPFTTYLDSASSIFQGYKSGILNNSCCW